MRTYSSIRKIVRKVLSHILNKKFLTFFLFVFLSTIFWFFTTLNENVNQDFTIPLRLVNVPENVVITTDLPENLNVTLNDKGMTLLMMNYTGLKKSIVVDFNKYSTLNGHVSFSTNELIKQINGEIPATTQIKHVRPQALEYFFNYGESKRIAVKVEQKLECAPQHYISSLEVSPESITIYAIPTILDTIRYVYTRPLFSNNLDKRKEMRVALQPIKGVKFIPDSLKIDINVDKLVEKTIEATVHPINFPQDKKLRTFPAKIKIKFQVGMNLYHSITSKDFVLPINYEDIKNSDKHTYHLKLNTIPPGVRYVNIMPQDVEYVLENIPVATNNGSE